MLRHLLLAVASTVLALALLEVGLRATNVAVHDFAHDLEKYGSLIVWDDAGGYFRHVPEASAELGRVSVRFNSLGMRDREPRIPKPPGTFRVFCLGDSVTFGPGVPEDETFPARLRAELASVGVDVVVGAVQGWNSDQEEHFLAANIDRLAPDLVVLLYVVNDIEPTERMRLAYVPSTRWSDRAYRQLVLRSRLFEWGAFLYRGWTAHGGLAGLERMAYWQKRRDEEGPAFAPTDPGWIASRDALAQMQAAIRRRGARFAIFLHDLGSPALAPIALERLQEFGREAGVPVVDTAGFYAGRDPATLVNRPFVDPHPNAIGHALLARGVARELRDRGLVPPAGPPAAPSARNPGAGSAAEPTSTAESGPGCGPRTTARHRPARRYGGMEARACSRARRSTSPDASPQSTT